MKEFDSLNLRTALSMVEEKRKKTEIEVKDLKSIIEMRRSELDGLAGHPDVARLIRDEIPHTETRIGTLEADVVSFKDKESKINHILNGGKIENEVEQRNLDVFLKKLLQGVPLVRVKESINIDEEIAQAITDMEEIKLEQESLTTARATSLPSFQKKAVEKKLEKLQLSQKNLDVHSLETNSSTLASSSVSTNMFAIMNSRVEPVSKNRANGSQPGDSRHLALGKRSGN